MSEVDETATKRPCLNNFPIWVLNKTKSEEALVKLICQRGDLVESIFSLMEIDRVNETLITHRGISLPRKQNLMQLAETATQECPIVLERCVVWVNKDRRTRLKEYEYNDYLQSLYDDRHSVILFDDKIQEGMTHVCKCHNIKESFVH